MHVRVLTLSTRTPPRARATAGDTARSRAQPQGMRPNGRQQRSAPGCTAPHRLQQTSKVPAAPAPRRQQQNPWPVEKLRLEVGACRGSEAGDGHGEGLPRMHGRGARHTLLQRQLELAAAATAAKTTVAKKNGWCCRAARSPGGGVVEGEADFRSRRGWSGTVRAHREVGRLRGAVLSHL